MYVGLGHPIPAALAAAGRQLFSYQDFIKDLLQSGECGPVGGAGGGQLVDYDFAWCLAGLAFPEVNYLHLSGTLGSRTEQGSQASDGVMDQHDQQVYFIRQDSVHPGHSQW